MCQESGFMTKLWAFSFSFILLTVSLAGCLGLDEDDDSENDVLVCSEMEFTTHEVTISYIDYELKSWGDSNQLFGILVIENSDLIYFEDATQVLANGQIYDLNPRGAPIRDTHTRFTVEYNEDNEDPRLDTNEGDVVCLIENPDGGTELEWEKGRDCITESSRLENGSYEHAEPMCNYILTEHLDRTSTIRGGIELPQNLEIEFCSNMTSVLNVYNGSIVSVNYTVAENWGHFVEGNEFRIYYNDLDEPYHKTYYVRELTETPQSGFIYTKGILNHHTIGCSIAYVMLYADENLTEEASLDRNLTSDDMWEVFAEECTFYRNNFIANSSEMPIIHSCEGMIKGIDTVWLVNNDPDFDTDAYLEQQAEWETRESTTDFFNSFTQAMITKNYSVWHNMLGDDIHAINSNITYNKSNLTEAFFENFTNALGTIEFENASRLDLAQSHLRLEHAPYSPNESNFNWIFDPTGYGSEVIPPIAESVLSQDRIYNYTGWGYGDTFIDSMNYSIISWAPGPNTPILLSEYLLTIVVERGEDGDLSIVGIADYTVQVTR